MFLFSFLFKLSTFICPKKSYPTSKSKIISSFKRYTLFLLALEMFSTHVLVFNFSWLNICLQCKVKAEVQFFLIYIEFWGLIFAIKLREQLWGAAWWQNACLAYVKLWHSVPSTEKCVWGGGGEIEKEHSDQ